MTEKPGIRDRPDHSGEDHKSPSHKPDPAAHPDQQRPDHSTDIASTCDIYPDGKTESDMSHTVDNIAYVMNRPSKSIAASLPEHTKDAQKSGNG